jgi:hypothetical protein
VLVEVEVMLEDAVVEDEGMEVMLELGEDMGDVWVDEDGVDVGCGL